LYDSDLCNISLKGHTDAGQFSNYPSFARQIRRPELRQINRSKSLQQTRSISLFGWGSKSSGTDDFAKTHGPSPPPATDLGATPPAPAVESLRTVKASNSTSAAPDPASTGPIDTDALKGIESSVLQSQNAPTSTATVTDTADLTAVPEGIGYLRDVCGLDFGWGPTAVMEFLLEHIHITGGLPWATSIMGLVVVIRLGMFPLYRSAADASARFAEVRPTLNELTAKSKECARNNDREGIMSAQLEMRELRKEYGLSFTKLFRPLLLQIPLGFGAWKLLRSCSALPVPAFETESWLWVSSLTMGDTWFILPILTAGLTWLNLNTNLKAQGQEAANSPGMAYIRNLFPLASGGFLALQPASVQIYFLVNGLISQLQITSFNNPSARRFLRLYPLPTQSSGSATQTRYSTMNVSSPVITTTARKASGPKAGSVSALKPEPAPVPVVERSFIDKGVDAIKAAGKGQWQKIMTPAKDKQKEQQKQAQKDAASRYEAQRQQDQRELRMYRNSAQNRKTQQGSGKN
jgi:YidC/Oxa1 family membrane protein insertase